jgi:hypothetical protein
LSNAGLGGEGTLECEVVRLVSGRILTLGLLLREVHEQELPSGQVEPVVPHD